MAIALVQTGTAINVGSGTSGTITLTGVAAGNLLIVYASDVDGTGVSFSVSDDQGNTWASAVANDNSGYSSAILYCLSAAAGTTVITVTASSSTAIVAQAQEWSGDGTWELDQTSLIDESATTNHVCSVDFRNIDTKGAAVVACNSATADGGNFGACTPGTGYTELVSPGARTYWQYQVFSAATADERGSFTSASSKATAACIASFICPVSDSGGTGCWWPCCTGGGSTASSAVCYHLGGSSSSTGSTFYNKIDKTLFATDVSYQIAATLSTSRQAAGGAAEPSVSGWTIGGSTAGTGTTNVATADETDFSTDATSVRVAAALSIARSEPAAVSERSTKAYFAGGVSNQVPLGNLTNRGDMLTFSTGTTASQTTANLSTSNSGSRGMTEGTTKGYYLGRQSSAVSDKLTFSSDTAAAQTTANLTGAIAWGGTISDGSTKGYYSGGVSASEATFGNKVTFSTDTTSSQTSVQVNRSFVSSGSDGISGYIGGGSTGGVTCLIPSTVYKYTFASDSVATLGSGANLNFERIAVAGFSTSAL